MTATARHVAVTGIGAVTPYGVGVQALRTGLLAGRPTAASIQAFDASDLPVRFACEVAGFEPTAHLPTRIVRRTDRFAQFALVSADEALTDADLLDDARDRPERRLHAGIDPTRLAVVIASGSGGVASHAEADRDLRTRGPVGISPYLPLTRPADAAAAAVAQRFAFSGPSWAVASACASGTDAIGVGLDLLRAGRADVVITGGAEAAIDRLTLAAFARTGALSRRNHDPATASRPFDADRDGFVCGEGAGILVLERVEHAVSRGARVLAYLAGSASTTDTTGTLEPAADGSAAARTLELALRDAQLSPADVGHVDAHGTSTIANDPAEARAIQTVFDRRVGTVPVTALKSAIGHTMGAAGALAAVSAVATIGDGLIPPTQNHERRDPECDIDLVTGGPRWCAQPVVVSQAFGFGGHNSAIVLAGSM